MAAIIDILEDLLDGTPEYTADLAAEVADAFGDAIPSEEDMDRMYEEHLATQDNDRFFDVDRFMGRFDDAA